MSAAVPSKYLLIRSPRCPGVSTQRCLPSGAPPRVPSLTRPPHESGDRPRATRRRRSLTSGPGTGRDVGGAIAPDPGYTGPSTVARPPERFTQPSVPAIQIDDVQEPLAPEIAR